jgi:hypothetical protein
MADRGARGVFNVASGELTNNGEIANLFLSVGWRVTFSGDASPPVPPRTDVARLQALGVSPAPVKEVVRRYLKRLAG